MKQQATFDGVIWYDITKTKTEEVKTRKKTMTFTKLYFRDEHAPAYDYEVEAIREIGE